MRRRRYIQGVGAGVGGLVLGRGPLVAGRTEPISVRIVDANDPVEGGDTLEVTGEVENGGGDGERVELEFFVGDDALSRRELAELGAGETRSLEFHHRTYPVRQDSTFPVEIAGPDGADQRTVEVLGTGELDAGVVSPAADLTVRPGATVLFEVAPETLDEFGGQTHWYLDGAYVGHSSGPWYAAYAAETGADYWQQTFESTGSFTVRAVVLGEENAATSWSVTVADDGGSGPSIDAARPDPGSIDADESETLEFEVEVADPDGELRRVVWWLEQADTVLGVSDVDGAEDTASLSVPGSALCHSCSVVPWVTSASGRLTEARLWTANRLFDGEFAVSIVETNDPVEAGGFLEAVVAVENRGESSVSRELRLEVGDETVDAETVDLGAGEGDEVALGYDTYPVRTDVRFPIRVVSDDDSDTRSVDVFAQDAGPTRIRILETNAPVAAGEFLEVTTAVEHLGESTVTRAIHLVAGDRVDTEDVTLSPGESTTLSLGYDTYPVGQDVEFSVAVETEGYRDERSVRVFADGVPSFHVVDIEADDPVEAGEFLEVSATLENAGESERTDEARLVVGGETVDVVDATVPGGDAEGVSLGYDTYPVSRDVTFPVTVETDADAADTTVEVVAVDSDPEPEVEFESCQRALVTGEFDDGETLSASTDFYDTAGFGNTIREDWLTVGEHVEAPFDGTVVFEVGADDGVSSDGDEAVVTVREYGRFGTAIAGVRTPAAAPGESFDHANPHDCLDEIRPPRPSLSVVDVTAFEDGALEVTFEAENPTDADIPVESEFEGTTDDEPPAELAAGATTAVATWTPAVDDERLAWEVDFSRFEYDDPARAETEPAADYLPAAGLAVSIVDVNDPVEAGEFLEVVVEVTNNGDTEATEELRLVVGGEEVDTASVTVAGVATETTTLGYRTAAVAQDVQFAVTVEGESDSDERTVEVRGEDLDDDTEGTEDPDDETGATEEPDGTEMEGETEGAEEPDEAEAEDAPLEEGDDDSPTDGAADSNGPADDTEPADEDDAAGTEGQTDDGTVGGDADSNGNSRLGTD